MCGADAGLQCPACSRSVGEDHAPVLSDDPVRVVGYLPGIAVGIDEHARVATPERLPGLAGDRSAGGPRLGDDRVDLVGRTRVVRESHTAIPAPPHHTAVLGEPVAVPEGEHHPARLEEDDFELYRRGAPPAERFIEGACTLEVGDPEGDEA